jgi:hypothetical protein
MYPIASAMETAGGVFGATAALLVVGGAVFLRWQRSRQEFALTQAAMERGASVPLQGPPAWLASLRQGVMLVVLGLGLAVMGGVWWRLGSGVALPDAAATAATGPAIRDIEGRKSKGEVKPPPSAEMERWKRAQAQRTLGFVLVGAGGIIALLGATRVVFARIEKRYASEAGAASDE